MGLVWHSRKLLPCALQKCRQSVSPRKSEWLQWFSVVGNHGSIGRYHVESACNVIRLGQMSLPNAYE